MGEHLFDTNTGMVLFEPDPGEDPPPVLSDAELEALTLTEAARYDIDPPDSDLAGLLSWLPRPFLALVLAVMDRTVLSGLERVRLLEGDARLRSMVDADIYAGIAAVYDAESELLGGDVGADAFEQASAEIGAALALTRRAADKETSTALELADQPRILSALGEGSIDYRRARILLAHLTGLDTHTAGRVLDQTLPEASTMTTGQLNARLSRLTITVDPDAAAERYHQGIGERRVWVQANPDGTTSLCGEQLPPDRAITAARHLHQLAKELKTNGDTRSLDQIKADLYLDLLNGQDPDTPDKSGTRGVQVTVDLETLSELADYPGTLDTTPVIAEITRKTIAAHTNGKWTFTVTHNGVPISTGTLTRRPNTALKQHVTAAYPTCIFPGCRMPATQTDLDHRTPWTQHGPTSLENLAPLCRHHHKLKHHGWKLTRNPDDTHTWTSPLGHTYTTPPKPP